MEQLKAFNIVKEKLTSASVKLPGFQWTILNYNALGLRHRSRTVAGANKSRSFHYLC